MKVEDTDPSESVRPMVKVMSEFFKRDNSRNFDNHISAVGTCGVDHLNKIHFLAKNRRINKKRASIRVQKVLWNMVKEVKCRSHQKLLTNDFLNYRVNIPPESLNAFT